MTTDITELAQRMKAAAVRAKTATEEYASGHMSVSVCFAECEEFNRLTDGPDNILALVEALEKAQGMEAYWKAQCRGITDHCEELQARIAELESRTVKIPYLPDDCDRTEAHYKYQAALRDAAIKVEAE
ncbi:hypothetical protein [Klebsiella pneumoniae]|uniref:hypothetical protein n=1 Tax=Klebsiella pneumoniae TaxID=573 RepID=UPI001F4E06D3|nr:hypothetical protein [Klebsiella pneumoniae]MCH9349005.1 hypothetical protein [Klebsiella pneumoniae]MCH9439191.1 hypothetical protein [Klebsiella pneumoniae]MCH9468319.1 hypothetical protein [Klebsiella pneumoniae]MCH9471181.1 hypothetical protein [Klebsiella pneumoniae]MCH9476962.1 hypothetical protein [Klebsiella pneumoniae]